MDRIKNPSDLDNKYRFDILKEYNESGDECVYTDEEGIERLKYANYTPEEFIWWLGENNYRIVRI
jgi:hypothetical protein